MKRITSLIASAALATTVGIVRAAEPVAAQAAKPLPQVAANWKLDIVAQAPVVRWPSVVEAAPDGRIFVAEDPMDMPGPSNKPLDRILCIHPDGKITVFAENLNAVFGLRYIDGKVYVHHTPKFTVFTDDHGVGKNPVDFWDSDHPYPSMNGGGFNDHIPSNARLAMDNYLYISTGDKGIFGLKSNIDGKTVEIHGGGVFRVRPDGRDAEVYSTGTRNHLDVEINAEDEIFTYDNTDDGRGWWTRYTHMVDGGYYGYPHDYRPEEENVKDMAQYTQTKGAFPYRPWTLWRIDETGGGSACGGTGYNEDALPAEYYSNTFNCEWGKGKIQRFRTQRDGGTYKIVTLEDVVTGAGDFRPVGISVTADGTGFYIADWNYGGWRSNVMAGRLLKLTYTGAMHPTAKPAWYVPAAQAEPFTATTQELVAGLSHPAESVRLVAQRRLADRFATEGAKVVDALTAVVTHRTAPSHARWHAIWSLDRIEGGKAGRAAIIAAAKDEKSDLSVRLQAVRQLGTRRAIEATDVCIALLDHPDAAMRFRAATALGRIGNSAAVEPLISHLDQTDLFARFATFTALKRIGLADAKAWPAIVNGFARPKPEMRAGTALALRQVYDKALVEALAAFVTYPNNAPEARAAALASLADLHRQHPAWDGKWWGTQPQRTPEPGKSVDWDGTPIVLASISQSLSTPNAIVRAAALDTLRDVPNPDAVPALLAMFDQEQNVASKRAVLNALASAKSTAAMKIVVPLLSNPGSSAELVPDAVSVAEAINSPESVAAIISLAASSSPADSLTAAFAALGRMRAAKAIPVLSQQVQNSDVAIASSAANALGAIGGKDGAKALIPLAGDKRTEVRQAVVVALGLTQDSNAIPALVEAAKDPQTKVQAITALTKRPNVKATDALLDGLGSTDGGLRSLCRKALEQIGAAAMPTIDQRLEKGPPLTRIAIGELQKLYSKLEPVKNWQITGPLALATPDALSPQSVTDINKLPTISANGKPLEWSKASSSRDGFVDLSAAYDHAEHVYAWAVAELNSPYERDLTLSAGSDDGIILWVNGKEVLKDLNNHAWQPGQFQATVHVNKGRNILVAKITQDTGPWGFSVAYIGEQKGKLWEVDMKSTDVTTYDAYAVGHEGEPGKGKALFNNAQALGCIKCHVVNGKGGNVGPDLTGIGLKYDRAQLIESVLYPSKRIESGYEQTIIRTKDGNVVAGVVRGETEADVTLYDSSANKIVVRKQDVAQRKTSPVSVMPEGLQAGLTHQQFADLVAYLQSLKEAAKK